MSYFTYKESRLSAENIDLADIVKSIGTPFYCYSLSSLQDKYKALSSSYTNDNLLICYSIKANSNQSIIEDAKNHAVNFAKKISYVGTFCLEFFITDKSELLLNEIAPRVHNSGHLTIESYNVSQFESHLRSVCDLEKIKPLLRYKSEMTNILGEDIYNYRDKEFKKDEYFHDYYKKESKIGRKMGHFTKILT